MRVISLLMMLTMVSPLAHSADRPLVGRKAAARYLANGPKDSQEVKEVSDTPAASESTNSSPARGEDLLMLGLGSFLNSRSYEWDGVNTIVDPGHLSYGVTYMFGEWSKFDLSFRMDFNDYRLVGDDRASKLSLLPLLTFPQANRNFPLYFGIGAGLGVFFEQVNRESNISFDYQLVMGLRFQDLIENIGFFTELALKNHLHLTTVGQFNGTALTAGVVFSF